MAIIGTIKASASEMPVIADGFNGVLIPPGSTSKVDLTFVRRGVGMEYVSWRLKTNQVGFSRRRFNLKCSSVYGV